MAAEVDGVRRLPTVSGGHGPRFIRHRGTVAPLVLEDPGSTGATTGAEPPERVHDDDWEGASILIARDSVGTGGDPLSAVAGLLNSGVRAILAPGFAPDLYADLVASGVLPVTLEEEVISGIADRVASDPEMEITIDLETQLVECSCQEPVPFTTDPRARNKLLLGLTDLDEMIRHVEEAAALRTRDRDRRPWMYGGA